MDFISEAAHFFLCQSDNVTIDEMVVMLNTQNETNGSAYPREEIIVWEPFERDTVDSLLTHIETLAEAMEGCAKLGEIEMHSKVMDIITYDDLDEEEKFKQIKELEILE